MKTVSIHDAKTNLSKYIAAAKKGEKIYIGNFGKAEVILTKLPSRDRTYGTRDFSAAQGKISASDDAFSEMTDSEVSKLLLNKK